MQQPDNGYAFSLDIKVRDYEVDSQGIVNNAVYLHYMEHTRHEFCEHAGLTFRQMSADGVDPVVRNINITYLSPLRLGDRAVSRLSLRRDGARFIFRQVISRADDGRPVAEADVTIVCTRDGRLTRGDELADAFKSYL